MGVNITRFLKEGKRGKPVTAKMRNPGAKRKTIDLDETESNPKVVASQYNYRKKFIEKANLRSYFMFNLKIEL